MPFFGEYTLTITDNQIHIPFSLDTAVAYSWYLSEAPDRKNLIIYVTKENQPDPDFDHILEEGPVELNTDGNWTLPARFINYIGRRDITLCGINTYFEISASDYFQQQMDELDSMLDILDELL